MMPCKTDRLRAWKVQVAPSKEIRNLLSELFRDLLDAEEKRERVGLEI
jgi:hypothetical protein